MCEAGAGGKHARNPSVQPFRQWLKAGLRLSLDGWPGMEQVISLCLQLKKLENLRLNSSARVRLLRPDTGLGPE